MKLNDEWQARAFKRQKNYAWFEDMEMKYLFVFTVTNIICLQMEEDYQKETLVCLEYVTQFLTIFFSFSARLNNVYSS